MANLSGRGMTLVELLVVIGIIAILIAVAGPRVLQIMQSDTIVRSAAKTLVTDIKTAQSQAFRRGGGQMSNGVLVENSVFIVFDTDANTYRTYAYSDTNGNGIRDNNPVDTIPLLTTVVFSSGVHFGRLAGVTKGACGNDALPAATQVTYLTQNAAPCDGNRCVELGANGFPNNGTTGTIYLTNDRESYAVSLNIAGNTTICKWSNSSWFIVH